jgi:hypothetical protein
VEREPVSAPPTETWSPTPAGDSEAEQVRNAVRTAAQFFISNVPHSNVDPGVTRGHVDYSRLALGANPIQGVLSGEVRTDPSSGQLLQVNLSVSDRPEDGGSERETLALEHNKKVGFLGTGGRQDVYQVKGTAHRGEGRFDPADEPPPADGFRIYGLPPTAWT